MSLRDIEIKSLETDCGMQLRVGIRIFVKMCENQAP